MAIPVVTPLEEWLLENGWWSKISGYYTNGKNFVSKVGDEFYLRDEMSLPITSGTQQEILTEVQKLCRK